MMDCEYNIYNFLKVSCVGVKYYSIMGYRGKEREREREREREKGMERERE